MSLLTNGNYYKYTDHDSGETIYIHITNHQMLENAAAYSVEISDYAGDLELIVCSNLLRGVGLDHKYYTHLSIPLTSKLKPSTKEELNFEAKQNILKGILEYDEQTKDSPFSVNKVLYNPTEARQELRRKLHELLEKYE